MQMVSIHEAKAHFSQLINQALNGEEIVVMRGGKALVRFTPYTEELPKRQGGQLKGMLKIAPNFDDPLPESFLKNFYGNE